jgi:cytochrome P450
VRRKFNLAIILFPESYKWNLNSCDRENIRNVKRIRSFLLSLIQKRKREFTDPAFIDKGDLMSTLLKTDLFTDDEMIIDECFTFFFAGSQTISASTANEVIFLN